MNIASKLLLAMTAQLFGAAAAWADAPVIFAFPGKGSSSSWDAGAALGLSQALALDGKDVAFVGNSSGSILTAHFGCHGLTPASAQALIDILGPFDRSVLNEQVTDKLSLLFGREPMNDRAVMQPTLQKILDTCPDVNAFPMAIAAANRDIITQQKRDPLNDGKPKAYNPLTLSVGTSAGYVGKACTVFANAKALAILERIPADGRMCDLRPIDTIADLSLAIWASISEPTYFDQVADPEPARVITADGKTLSKRVYKGGFVQLPMLRDWKRVEPSANVISTGRESFNIVSQKLVVNWYMLSLNDMVSRDRYWFDMTLPVSAAAHKTIADVRAPAADGVRLGCLQVKACVQQDSACLPDPAIAPEDHGLDANGQAIPHGRGFLAQLVKERIAICL